MTWLAHPAEIRTLSYMGFATTVAVAHWTIGVFNPWLLCECDASQPLALPDMASA
jgi:hypothetical protein